jgi:hypothetical protein
VQNGVIVESALSAIGGGDHVLRWLNVAERDPAYLGCNAQFCLNIGFRNHKVEREIGQLFVRWRFGEV